MPKLITTAETLARANTRAVHNIARAPVKLPRPPTPWMRVTNPATQLEYVVRLMIRRRGGALHLQFAPNDVTQPGKEFYMRSSRPGYYEFIQAGQTLLRASMWDPKCEPGSRAVWNHNAAEYGQRTQNAQTVATYIERIVSPQKGRPARAVLAESREAAARGVGGLRTGYATARAKRRNDMLSLAQRFTNALIDVTEAVSDTRRYVGYTRTERAALLLLLGELRMGAEALRHRVFTDDLGERPTTPARAVGRRLTEISEAVHEEMSHDMDEFLKPPTPPNEAELRTERCTTGAEAVGQFEKPIPKVDLFLKPDEMAYFDEHHEFPDSATSRSDEDRQAMWDELNARVGRVVGGARRSEAKR